MRVTRDGIEDWGLRIEDSPSASACGQSDRFVGARRVAGECVAQCGPGAGTGAAAQFAVLANAAFPFEIRAVAQAFEDLAFAIDVDQRLLLDVARFEGKEAARI